MRILVLNLCLALGTVYLALAGVAKESSDGAAKHQAGVSQSEPAAANSGIRDLLSGLYNTPVAQPDTSGDTNFIQVPKIEVFDATRPNVFLNLRTAIADHLFFVRPRTRESWTAGEGILPRDNGECNWVAVIGMFSLLGWAYLYHAAGKPAFETYWLSFLAGACLAGVLCALMPGGRVQGSFLALDELRFAFSKPLLKGGVAALAWMADASSSFGACPGRDSGLPYPPGLCGSRLGVALP